MKARQASTDRLLVVVTAFVSFLAGAVIYLLFRPKQLLGFSVIEHLGLGPVADRLRDWASPVALPEAVIYCVPNGLWSLSYVLLVEACMPFKTRRSQCLFAAVIPALGCFSELLQGCEWLRGTFDVGDVVCYSAPLLIYYIFKIYHRE